MAHPLSLETRVLRLGGIALMLLASVPGAAFSTLADEPLWFLSPSRTVTLVMFLALAANLLVLGLVFLLAGLRELSLLHDRRARRGAAARLIAANLGVGTGVAVALDDSRALESVEHGEYILTAVLLVGMVLARRATRTFRGSWKYEAPSAAEALARDPRAPVVYLRPFGVDQEILVTARGFAARLSQLVQVYAAVSPEQELAWILDRVGPVVAIGRPGERLPELGAARMYVADDDWRQVVGALLDRAALVVIRAGDTPNLWWELEQAVLRCRPQRVIIVALDAPNCLREFDRRFVGAFGAPLRSPEPRGALLFRAIQLVFPFHHPIGRVLYFDGAGIPHEEPIRFAPSAYWLPSYVFSPYGAPLRSALQRVFAALELPWISKRRLAGAVLLALFGGAFGLHYFYMGDRRRALRRCAWAVTGVPAILGIVDAIRLALLDEVTFQQRIAGSSPSAVEAGAARPSDVVT